MWHPKLYYFLTRISVLFLIVFLMLALNGCATQRTVKNEYEPPKVVLKEKVVIHNGAIFQANMPVSLVADTTARHVGDIVTIKLVESASAKSNSNTAAAKKQTVNMPSPTIAGSAVTHNNQEVLETKVNGDRDFSSNGNSDESHNFTATLTVSVGKVMPNGYLVVRGEKIIELNQSQQFIQFSGIVRPQDIDINNSVDSLKVADAKIRYSEKGVMSDANTMGPMAKFFQSPAYPY